MAINKNKTGLQGTIGGLQYRQVNGKEIVSEKAVNKKNPKTVRQMAHRVKWMNISAMYRAADGALYNAFEGKSGNINDYTLFMGANLYLEQEVYLTKQEKENNACVVAPYQISRGMLPSIGMHLENNQLTTDIRLGEFAISSETSVGDLAMVIQKENSSFQEDDCLSIILFTQEWNDNTNVPTASCDKEIIKLDSYDETPLDTVLSCVKVCNQNGVLAITQLCGDYGIAVVHSRKKVNGNVAISTQYLEVKNALFDQYSSKEQQRKAMVSYGVKEDPFLAHGAGSKKSRRNEGF